MPADVTECHCGTTRRLAEAWVAAEDRKGRSGWNLSIPDLLGQIAVLGAVFYLGFAWQQPSTAPSLPSARPTVSSPDRDASAEEARTAPPSLAPRPSEPERPPALSMSGEAEEAPAASPLDPVKSPEPRPTPTPQVERSEMDLKRDEAQKLFEQTLGRLEREARTLASNASQFEALCVGGRGEAGSCTNVLAEITTSAESLGREVQQAEEDARKAWVTPGSVRDMRHRHGLDEGTVNELAAHVRRLESRFQGKS